MHFSNLKSNFRKPAGSQTLKWLLGWHDEKRPKSPATGVVIPYMHNDGQGLRRATADTLTWIGQASFLIRAGREKPADRSRAFPVARFHQAQFATRAGLRRPCRSPTWYSSRTTIVTIWMPRPSNGSARNRSMSFRKGWATGSGTTGFRASSRWAGGNRKKSKGCDVTFVPAEHWSRRSLTDINTSWWGGYVIARNGLRIYHSGDTGWFDGFSGIAERFPDIHAAMLPVGAYAPRWFMRAQHIDPEEAVKAFRILGAKQFVGMHWGTFKLSDEPLDEPMHVLPLIWEKEELERQRLESGVLGKTLRLDKLV